MQDGQYFVIEKNYFDIWTVVGEPFLEGLLVDGWLLKLIFTQGRVEKSISTWIFNLSECNTTVSYLQNAYVTLC